MIQKSARKRGCVFDRTALRACLMTITSVFKCNWCNQLLVGGESVAALRCASEWGVYDDHFCSDCWEKIEAGDSSVAARILRTWIMQRTQLAFYTPQEEQLGERGPHSQEAHVNALQKRDRQQRALAVIEEADRPD